MTPYAISSGSIPPELVECFRIMRNVIENLPDFEGEELTCHAVCTALAKRYNLTCIDGHFGVGNEHSWLIDPAHPKVVMDMYPVAGASSFIVFNHWLVPWHALYIPKQFDIDTTIRERQVAKILAVI